MQCLLQRLAAGRAIGTRVEGGGEGVFSAGVVVEGGAGGGEGVGGGAEEGDDGPGGAAGGWGGCAGFEVAVCDDCGGAGAGFDRGGGDCREEEGEESEEGGEVEMHVWGRDEAMEGR